MRYTRILCLGLSIPAVLLAADLFANLGLNQQTFEDTCFHFVEHPDRLPSFQITPAMRALAVVQRKSAAEAIGAKAKAYYASETFKKRWAEHRAKFTGDAEQEAMSAKYAAQGEQQEDAAIQQMEQMMSMVPPSKQAEVKKAIEKAKADRAKKQKRKAAGESHVDNAPPKDPKVQIKKALQHFLAETDGVDYGAATTFRDGRKYFANQAHESKPEVWKMAFRAGREASEGARAYVRNWINELK